MTEGKDERRNLLIFIVGIVVGVIGNFFVECLIALMPLSENLALIGYILSFAFLLCVCLVFFYLAFRKS